MLSPSILSAIANCVQCCKKRSHWLRRAKRFNRPRVATRNASSHGSARSRAYDGFQDSAMTPLYSPMPSNGFGRRVWAKNRTLRQPAFWDFLQLSTTLFLFLFPFPFPFPFLSLCPWLG